LLISESDDDIDITSFGKAVDDCDAVVIGVVANEDVVVVVNCGGVIVVAVAGNGGTSNFGGEIG
jgi:hypothetical protein